MMKLVTQFNGAYSGKKVLITGDMGFKGSWLALWLNSLSSHLAGFSIKPCVNDYHSNILNISYPHFVGDVRDAERLTQVIEETKPQVIFHFAAQSLVRESYSDPLESISTNILGTANLLECCRNKEYLDAVIIATSDKCYKNHDEVHSFSEEDPLGGHDPYSASKACQEIVAQSFMNSFYSGMESQNQTLIATVRAGNVIGGGDMAKDRIFPDIARATFANKAVAIRQPTAIRPWQHVLDCLSGYLLLGEKLMSGSREFAGSWNFGPNSENVLNVGELIDLLKQNWSRIQIEFINPKLESPKEAAYLDLDCTKANETLGWYPVWDIRDSVFHTGEWYKEKLVNDSVMSRQQLSFYIDDAYSKGAVWIS